MFGERRTGFRAKPGHDIERPFRQAGPFGDPGKFQNGQAGFFGRLDHGGVTHGQCRAKTAAQNLHRVVPRNDVAGNAVRLIDRQNRKTVLIRQRVAVHLVGGRAIKFEITR